MIRTKLTLLAVVAGMLVGSVAFASHTQVAPFNTKLTFGGNANLWSGQNVATSKGTFQTGAFLMTASGTGLQEATGTFYTYCVDFESVSDGDWYDKQSDGQQPSGTGIDLIPQSWANGALKKMAWLNQTYFDDSVTTKTKSTGFQLAVWNCLWDTDFTLSTGSGTFWATSGPGRSEGQTYLNALNSAYNSLGFVDYSADTVFWADSQVQMSKNSTTNTNAVVPEIPATALGPIGFMVLGLLKRRFAK